MHILERLQDHHASIIHIARKSYRRTCQILYFVMTTILFLLSCLGVSAEVSTRNFLWFANYVRENVEINRTSVLLRG